MNSEINYCGKCQLLDYLSKSVGECNCTRSPFHKFVLPILNDVCKEYEHKVVESSP